MYDKIFHFEIFKNFMEILKYFKTPSLKYFMKTSNRSINCKWPKCLNKVLVCAYLFYYFIKNMIKVYDVSRKYIMLFMHNNRYLPLTYFVAVNCTACTHSPSWNFWNISEIFQEIFHEIFHPKIFHEILHHYCESLFSDRPTQLHSNKMTNSSRMLIL